MRNSRRSGVVYRITTEPPGSEQTQSLEEHVIVHTSVPARYFAGLLLLTIGLPVSGLAAPIDRLPSWSKVSFEWQSLWATARSRISIAAGHDDQFGAVWVLQAEESIAEKRAQETQLMTPGSGSLLRRSRLSIGKDRRLKEYHYKTGRLERIRREPSASTDVPSAQWPVTSRRDIPYPALEQDAILTSMPALLLVAGRVLDASGQAATVYVHGDHNFYRVRLSVVGQEQVEVDYALVGGMQQMKGERTAIVVGLQVDPVGTRGGKPEFSLLGLGGRVSILVDEQTRLPLRVQGRAPRVGETHIDLVAADIGPPPREQVP
jgi:hypothetical protein